MDDDTRLEKLINQCKNNDVDLKVDAVTKLQAEFEAGIQASQINDPDGLINALKACLRTSNQHLTTATVSALPPLLPLLITPPIIQLQGGQSPDSPPVSSSTSSTVPSSIVDAVTLRQVLNAFLPVGGVVDRLGDNREKTREKARETLVILGGLAFRSGGSSIISRSKDGKGHETPLMMFERFLKEGGLGSKVWRTREQAILVLVHIRRAHHLFPIRVYLSQLVSALEDTDAHVRECARPSVVELFTGVGVTDAARADLKKEMTKKGVRKTIVDAVLSKLIAGGNTNGGGGSNPQSDGSENGDGVGIRGKEYVPPSLALQGRRPTGGAGSGAGPSITSRSVSVSSVKNISRPASRAATTEPATPVSDDVDLKPVYITSSRDMETEFSAMFKSFEGKETEHNWDAREKAILRVRGMLKGDAHLRYADTFLACLKEGFIQWSLKALASLRTTVSTNAASLYSELANALGPSLDPLCDTLLTHLLRMAGFTKKIAAQQSQATVTEILTHTSPQPRIVLPLLWNTLQEKTIQARAFVVAHLKNYLEVHGHRAKHAIESSGGIDILEKSLKKALADPNPTVRESARVCFWVFEEVWHEQGSAILESLDSVARKQLEKACPNPQAKAVSAPVTPKNSRKSSVAAAIAASRAKAKAIATAPPSLRHQATSSSHIARASSPTAKHGASPSSSPKSTTRSLSPHSRPSPSSPSPKSRVGSNGMLRSVSSSVPTTHSRSPPGSTRAESPPSSAVQMSTFRRRASSPLATSPKRGDTLNRTSQLTVLPPSVVKISKTMRNGASRTVPGSGPPQPSTVAPYESLLLAASMPLPEDSDSDESANLLSFSAAFEASQTRPKSDSQALSFSPRSEPTAGPSSALSTGSAPDGAGQPIVEDALRARAEQAESAAERLLELVDLEEEGSHHSTIPVSLLVGSNSALPPLLKPTPHTSKPPSNPPVTPMNKNTAILRKAAMFKDSPAPNGSSSSLLDVLKDEKHETVRWPNRMKLIDRGTHPKAATPTDRVQELQTYIVTLEKGDAEVGVLQRLALFCIENPASLPSPSVQPSSPSPFIDKPHSSPSPLWTKDKNFDRLFNALITFLDPGKSEMEVEYGLIVLWEILEHLATCIEGREADIFSVLLRVRYCNKINVLEASNAIRDALTTRIEPVYGLTTMHASLRAFLLQPQPEWSDADTKAATCAFGLIALGKFILRLPAEILEEELPRLKTTLISSLNDKSSLVVRESAAASIIASQLVLRDETHLFALLDGLADEKKNLLTYLFDKHGVRGLSASNGSSGMNKLQKELRRLDTRTSTPPRPIHQPAAIA